MGRYTSKKQSIQEANRKLEERFINESNGWANMKLFKNSSDLDELGKTDHYVVRKKLRVDEITKVIVPKSALGDFSLGDIQEPLISALKEKINGKLDKLENMEKLPLSETYKVAYKIFEPVLYGMDKEKHPIKIFTPPTPEKREKGITEENVGTYYYIVVESNDIITLILSDNPDFEKAVKEHEERKGSDKPIRILNAPATFEFNLGEIMGIKKEEPRSKFIDPTELDYEIRSDYRTKDGGRFYHKKYGKGIIQNTSNGRVGEPDTRGILDWVDVKFPSLNGKIIRFDKIYAKKFFELQTKRMNLVNENQLIMELGDIDMKNLLQLRKSIENIKSEYEDILKKIKRQEKDGNPEEIKKLKSNLDKLMDKEKHINDMIDNIWKKG
jgi:hypothetical protein